MMINLILFIYFLSSGIELSDNSEHKFLGGMLIIISGFMLLALMTQSVFLNLLHPVYVIPFLSVISIYLLLFGGHKMFKRKKED